MSQILVVGERRSPRARKMRVRWEDEALAAVPLFEALRANAIDPLADCRFVNWFEGGKRHTSRHTGQILALGQKVQKALTAEGIAHIPLVHPAARGAIRLRANYIAHVTEALVALGRDA